MADSAIAVSRRLYEQTGLVSDEIHYLRVLRRHGSNDAAVKTAEAMLFLHHPDVPAPTAYAKALRPLLRSLPSVARKAPCDCSLLGLESNDWSQACWEGACRGTVVRIVNAERYYATLAAVAVAWKADARSPGSANGNAIGERLRCAAIRAAAAWLTCPCDLHLQAWLDTITINVPLWVPRPWWAHGHVALATPERLATAAAKLISNDKLVEVARETLLPFLRKVLKLELVPV